MCAHASVCLWTCVHLGSVLISSQITQYHLKSSLVKRIKIQLIPQEKKKDTGEKQMLCLRYLSLERMLLRMSSKSHHTFLQPFSQNNTYLCFKPNF